MDNEESKDRVYEVGVAVMSATGRTYFQVSAPSPEEAISRLKAMPDADRVKAMIREEQPEDGELLLADLDDDDVVDITAEVAADEAQREADAAIGLMRLRVVVACGDGTGGNGPGFYFCRILTTDSQYEHGEHYARASEAAKDDGCEGPFVAFDEADPECFALLDLFAWDTASVYRVGEEAEVV